MRKVCTLSAILVFASALAYAETFTGKLFDAGCVEQHKTEACAPTAETTSFAIQSSGKLLKLDADGNRKSRLKITVEGCGVPRVSLEQ